MSTPTNGERAPLLSDSERGQSGAGTSKARGVIWGALTLLFLVATVLLVFFGKVFGDPFAPWLGTLPSDPNLAALAILDKAPVIVSF